MKQFLCPYCFERPAFGSWKFVCQNKRCSSNSTGDTVFTLSSEERKGDPPRKKKCPNCGWEANWFLCPECEKKLPNDIGLYPSRILGLIGPKYAGKSHYVAAIINALRRGRLGRQFQCGLSSLNDETTARYEEEFYKPLYKDMVQLGATQTAVSYGSIPLHYCLTFERTKKVLGFTRKTLDPIFLPLFDTAGEDLLREDVVKRELLYLKESSGLVLLLDPLQTEPVRSRISDPSTLPEISADPIALIDRVVNLLREELQVPRKKKLPIHLAVAFAKIDDELAEKVLHPASRVLRESPHDGLFDLEDCEVVHQEMASYVDEWLGENFTTSLEQNFENFKYFGLTVLGQSPTPDGRLRGPVNSRRIADPLLWLLWQIGLIESKGGK